jgi:hypothetical protein
MVRQISDKNRAAVSRFLLMMNRSLMKDHEPTAIVCKAPDLDYREEHKELALQSERQPFLIRNSWAHRQGLLEVRGATFTDELEVQPGQAPYCRCYYLYLYSLNDLPASMRKKAAAE